MAFPELEWHAINEADFDGVENDIPEIIQGPGIPVLDNIEPVSTDATQQTLVLMKTSFPLSSEDTFNTSLRRFAKTSARGLANTFSRCLQNIFKRSCKNFFKTSSRYLQDVLKTSSRRSQDVSSS